MQTEESPSRFRFAEFAFSTGENESKQLAPSGSFAPVTLAVEILRRARAYATQTRATNGSIREIAGAKEKFIRVAPRHTHTHAAVAFIMPTSRPISTYRVSDIKRPVRRVPVDWVELESLGVLRHFASSQLF